MKNIKVNLMVLGAAGLVLLGGVVIAPTNNVIVSVGGLLVVIFGAGWLILKAFQIDKGS